MKQVNPLVCPTAHQLFGSVLINCIIAGTYPPLPDISQTDFSLLTDEVHVSHLHIVCHHSSIYPHVACVQEEWHILFFYVLQFPAMVREVADLNTCETDVRIETRLKKVCLHT